MLEVDELNLKFGEKDCKVDEEVKETKDIKKSSISESLPCYNFYNDLDSMRISDLI